MGGGAGAETTTKALRATASDGDGASVPLAEQQPPAPLPAAGSVAADGSPAVVQRCGEDDDQPDDEQVERFYALLANIRALRGLYSAGTGPADSGRRGRKRRARDDAAEAPWRPAFRLEDFEFEEEVSQKQKQGAADDARRARGGVARRPAAAACGARAAVAAADDDGREEDEVERGGNNKLGRRVAARG